MKRIAAFTFTALLGLAATAQSRWGDWQTWGEQGNGTFCNPIIPADYSDLDCIQVGKDYYAISSTMQFAPGMTILHSRDLVNWEIAGHAVADLTQISPELNWDRMDRYGRGIWAGSVRFHKGYFYVFFGTPDEGFFMTRAKKAQGPWDPLTCLMREKGWDDCSAFWDKNGKAYFIGTHFADNYRSYIFDMAPDGKSIVRHSARLIQEGYGREASKIIEHDGCFYIIFSEYRGRGRYVMGRRDKSMAGGFQEMKQLLGDNVEEHEPNQGGIVKGPDKKWYFLTHHGNGDWSGRIVSLLPVTWTDGWPMMGTVKDNEPGGMTWNAPMPEKSRHKPVLKRSDEFNGRRLGLQWQWNYQPREDMFSLNERKGWLRLHAFRPLETDRLLKAGNTLTQRSFRTKRNVVTIKMDIGNMADGEKAGLCHMAEHTGAIGLVKENGITSLETRHDDHTEKGTDIHTQAVWLRSEWSLDGVSVFSYSTDGRLFNTTSTYNLSWGFYRGDRIGIYNFNNESESGYVDVDYLHYEF